MLGTVQARALPTTCRQLVAGSTGKVSRGMGLNRSRGTTIKTSAIAAPIGEVICEPSSQPAYEVRNSWLDTNRANFYFLTAI